MPTSPNHNAVAAVNAVDGADDENFSTSAVPGAARLGSWQVSMSYWAVLSALVWLFYGALTASLYGTNNALLTIGLGIVAYSLVSVVATRIGVSHGLNSTLLSTSIFGRWGNSLTALLLAATTLYYALFESSILAVALQTYTGAGDIRIWYAPPAEQLPS